MIQLYLKFNCHHAPRSKYARYRHLIVQLPCSSDLLVRCIWTPELLVNPGTTYPQGPNLVIPGLTLSTCWWSAKSTSYIFSSRTQTVLSYTLRYVKVLHIKYCWRGGEWSPTKADVLCDLLAEMWFIVNKVTIIFNPLQRTSPLLRIHTCCFLWPLRTFHVYEQVEVTRSQIWRIRRMVEHINPSVF